MATQEAEGLPGITLWDIARSLGRLESHAEQSDARMDRIESRIDRLMLAVLSVGTALIGGLVTALVKLFAG